MAQHYLFSCGHRGLAYPWGQGEDISQPDICPACRQARIGQVIRFARHGAPPASGTSRNHRDGDREVGVSVYEIANGAIQYTGWWYGIAERPLYLGRGEIVGWGADGEPVVRILSCRKARPAERARLIGE